MCNRLFLASLISVFLVQPALAEPTYRFNYSFSLNQKIKQDPDPEIPEDSGNWLPTTAIITASATDEPAYDCLYTILDGTSPTSGRSFITKGWGCKQQFLQITQNREQEVNTYEYRNVGEPISELVVYSGAISKELKTLTLAPNCYYASNSTYIYEWVEPNAFQQGFYKDGNSLWATGEGDHASSTPTMGDGKVYSKGPIITSASDSVVYSLCEN